MAGSRSRNLLPVAGKSKTCEPVNQERLKEAALVKSGVWNMRLWRVLGLGWIPKDSKNAHCCMYNAHGALVAFRPLSASMFHLHLAPLYFLSRFSLCSHVPVA